MKRNYIIKITYVLFHLILIFALLKCGFCNESETIYKSEETARKIVRLFFSDAGLKIGAIISLFLSVIFFFRIRNYVISIVFYLIANFFVFLGYKIANILFK